MVLNIIQRIVHDLLIKTRRCVFKKIFAIIILHSQKNLTGTSQDIFHERCRDAVHRTSMMKHSTVVSTPTKRSCIKQNYPIILQIRCILENHERRNSHRSFLSTCLHCIDVTLLRHACHRDSMTTPMLLQENRDDAFYFVRSDSSIMRLGPTKARTVESCGIRGP